MGVDVCQIAFKIKNLMGKLSSKSISTIRIVVQWFFMFWVVGIGVRFGLFVNAIESGTSLPWISRPPGVEGFLPIGALTSLKYWLVSGRIHPVHPAALVIFLAILVYVLRKPMANFFDARAESIRAGIDRAKLE